MRIQMLHQNLLGFTYCTQQPTRISRHIRQNSGFPPLKSISSSTNWPHHIRNCISQGAHIEALSVYNHIRHGRIHLLGVVPLLMKACGSLAMINHGKALHAESVKMGIECNVMVGTSLVDMYAKCGHILDSRSMFDFMPERNVVTWNAMIGGYMRKGSTSSALLLFEQMSARSVITWIEMIVGFANIGDTVTARNFFDRIPLELRTVVTWTVMVDGYATNGQMEAAKEIFEQMPIKNYFAWSSMITGYCKKGDVKEARALFDIIPERNLVNWNSLISGLSQNGFCEEALYMFTKMQTEGFEPDEVTLASVLSACAQLGLLDAGKEIHQIIIKKGIGLNQFVMNGLVDMYSKCGELGNARLIFGRMSKRNNACWNAMISGFSIHGQCEEALKFFGRMEVSSEQPNDITFLSVLSACSHGGLVEEGLEIFSKMEKYGLAAGIKHYGCLIDLLGRAGRLKEAYNLIKWMPVEPNETIWGALLGACRIHSNMDTANLVLEEVSRDSNPNCSNDSHYVLLANIYAASDSWEKAERMRIIMLDKGFQKTPGGSSFMPSCHLAT